MKLLLDQNLSPKLVTSVRDIYPGSLHIQDVRVGPGDDKDVWDFAHKENFTIVTKDSDFSERSLLFGFPPKVIWIRRGNCSTREIETILRLNRETIEMLREDSNIGVLTLL
ncbi:MAG: hypothetical protein GY940_43780 [bacterium]|nr:hypothetical protein [bacterium]